MIRFYELLASLADERPLFHSEADFQHAFAWALQRRHPQLSVRLEVPVRQGQSAIHVDLLASAGTESIAVELKYKTRALAVTVASEEFRLTNQAAQDLGRYDFIKDIRRLEQLVDHRHGTFGLAVLLTNDSSYWNDARGPDSVDAAFRLHPNRALAGALAWGARASAGTVRSREAPLALRGSYQIAWRDYSNVSAPRCGAFRYLAVDVGNGAGQQALHQTAAGVI